jgi:hypothetical protein
MFPIIEYVWNIRDLLKKDTTNHNRNLNLLRNNEERTLDKIRRRKSQVERCQYSEKDMCEICPILLGKDGKER